MPLFANRSYDADDFFGDEITSPAFCRCTIGTLDYSRVDDGRITCTECGRFWYLHVYVSKKNDQKYLSWWPNPCPRCNKPAEDCWHYGKKSRKSKTDD